MNSNFNTLNTLTAVIFVNHKGGPIKCFLDLEDLNMILSLRSKNFSHQSENNIYLSLYIYI